MWLPTYDCKFGALLTNNINIRIILWVLMLMCMPCTVFTTISSPSASPTRFSRQSILTIAGTGSSSNSGTGGRATSATLYHPRAIWVDSVGAVYWEEWSAYCIRKFSTTDSVVVNVAGVCGSNIITSNDNVPATAVSIHASSIYGNSAGVIYATDYSRNRIRTISTTGIMTTIAGTGAAGTGSSGDYGAATAANMYGPFALFLDSGYKLYIGCIDARLIRYVSAAGIIFPLAGKSNRF